METPEISAPPLEAHRLIGEARHLFQPGCLAGFIPAHKTKDDRTMIFVVANPKNGIGLGFTGDGMTLFRFTPSQVARLRDARVLVPLFVPH